MKALIIPNPARKRTLLRIPRRRKPSLQKQPRKRLRPTLWNLPPPPLQIPKPPPPAVDKPEEITSPVWLFYAKEAGLDERIKKILEKHGYTHVTAKGEWKTTYPVNYIFYRSKERKGLQHLASTLDDIDFKVFYHLDSATSPKLRGFFKDNPNLEFVLILQ